MNGINKSIQDYKLDDFNKLFKMGSGGFDTSVEKTSGHIYVDKKGGVHNINHALPTGKGDAASNRRLREQLVHAFQEQGASQDFLKRVSQDLGLADENGNRLDNRANGQPLSRRMVKSLLTDFSAGGNVISEDDYLLPLDESVVPANPKSVGNDPKGATQTTLAQEFLNGNLNYFKCLLPRGAGHPESRAIVQTCLLRMIESTIAEKGSVSIKDFKPESPMVKALGTILGNKDLGLKPLALACSLPPREAVAFLRAVAFLPENKFGMIERFFDAAPGLARLSGKEFTVGNVFRLARPELTVSPQLKGKTAPLEKDQFAAICEPLQSLYDEVSNRLSALGTAIAKASTDGEKIKASRQKNRLDQLSTLLEIGGTVKDVKACLADHKKFTLSMVPKAAFYSTFPATLEANGMTEVCSNLGKDMLSGKTDITVIRSDDGWPLHDAKITNEDDESGRRPQIVNDLQSHIAQLCGEKNVVQQRMVLLAMSKNGCLVESFMNAFHGKSEGMQPGMQFVLKRDQATGDILMSRQTPSGAGYGFSMTIRFRPDGSQSIVHLKSRDTGTAPAAVDEKGLPFEAAKNITSKKVSTKAELKEVKNYVSGWNKLLGKISGILKTYPDAFSAKLKACLQSLASPANRRVIAQFLDYLDRPGVDADYVRELVQQRIVTWASVQDEDTRELFKNFCTYVGKIKMVNSSFVAVNTASLDNELALGLFEFIQKTTADGYLGLLKGVEEEDDFLGDLRALRFILPDASNLVEHAEKLMLQRESSHNEALPEGKLQSVEQRNEQQVQVEQEPVQQVESDQVQPQKEQPIDNLDVAPQPELPGVQQDVQLPQSVGEITVALKDIVKQLAEFGDANGNQTQKVRLISERDKLQAALLEKSLSAKDWDQIKAIKKSSASFRNRLDHSLSGWTLTRFMCATDVEAALKALDPGLDIGKDKVPTLQTTFKQLKGQKWRNNVPLWARFSSVAEKCLMNGSTLQEIQKAQAEALFQYLLESAAASQLKEVVKIIDVNKLYHQTGGSNTCPIISMVNAMLTAKDSDRNVKASINKILQLRGDQGNKYYLFPFPDEEKGIRIYTKDLAKPPLEFIGNNGHLWKSLSEFEKAALLALYRKRIDLGFDGQYVLGKTFDLAPVAKLFGFGDGTVKTIGRPDNASLDLPQNELEMNLVELVNGLKNGAACVLRIPGHFMAITGVSFDNETHSPTITVIESVKGPRERTFSLNELANENGYQFYIM